MAEDRNSLLGVLAVRKGWAQPAEVLAAQQALGVHKDRDLAQELVDAGAMTLERARELETLADKALKDAGGNAGKAIAANGGMGVIAAAPKASSFGEDDDDEPTRMAAPDFGDDDDEATRVAPQGKSPAPAAASLDDEEDEPTKVLDWERATRKSIENAVADPVPPRKKP